LQGAIQSIRPTAREPVAPCVVGGETVKLARRNLIHLPTGRVHRQVVSEGVGRTRGSGQGSAVGGQRTEDRGQAWDTAGGAARLWNNRPAD
jgi:hypothetical protein